MTNPVQVAGLDQRVGQGGVVIVHILEEAAPGAWLYSMPLVPGAIWRGQGADHRRGVIGAGDAHLEAQYI